MSEIAAETAAGEVEFARLGEEGASWAARRDRASAMADLEAKREELERSLSSMLDRMAAAVEPASESGPVPVSAPRHPKRRSRANPAEQKPPPPEDRTGLQEERAAPDIVMPATWKEFPAWCEEHLADRLILSAKARNTIKKTRYEDVETATKCLLWLADDYRRARLDGVGDAAAGIRSRSTGTESGSRSNGM